MRSFFGAKAWTAVLAAMVAIGLVSAPAMAGSPRQVDDYREGKNKLIMVKGDNVKRKVLANNVRVVLKARNGQKTRANVNELVPGARILRLVNTDGDRAIEKVILRERSSGSSDCSFDVSTDEDGASHDESWDCSLSLDGVNEDLSKSCSFDSSEDSSGTMQSGDSSRDVSWDCSYDEDGKWKRDFSWNASFDASESASWGRAGGDSDGDTSFDASWDSRVALDKPLFTCRIVKNPLGWTCASAVLDQEIGVTLDAAPVGFDAYLDFSEDYVGNGNGSDTDSSCTKDGPGSFSCSFDTGDEAGDCSVDVSFDSSVDPDRKGGDVSGDMSYSCSYDIS